MKTDKSYVDRIDHGPNNPRNGEGSFITLKDGRIAIEALAEPSAHQPLAWSRRSAPALPGLPPYLGVLQTAGTANPPGTGHGIAGSRARCGVLLEPQ